MYRLEYFNLDRGKKCIGWTKNGKTVKHIRDSTVGVFEQIQSVWFYVPGHSHCVEEREQCELLLLTKPNTIFCY